RCLALRGGLRGGGALRVGQGGRGQRGALGGPRRGLVAAAREDLGDILGLRGDLLLLLLRHRRRLGGDELGALEGVGRRDLGGLGRLAGVVRRARGGLRPCGGVGRRGDLCGGRGAGLGDRAGCERADGGGRAGRERQDGRRGGDPGAVGAGTVFGAACAGREVPAGVAARAQPGQGEATCGQGCCSSGLGAVVHRDVRL